MQGEPQRCRESGMDDFAAKPTTIPHLAARLRKWLPHVEFPPATDDPAPGGDAGEDARGGGGPAGDGASDGPGDGPGDGAGDGPGDGAADAGATTRAGPSRRPPFDPAVLQDLAGGDDALVLAIQRDFVEASAADLARLVAAATAGDREEIRRHAHRIKGASAVVGATRVTTIAARLESMAADGRPDDLASLRTDLAASLAECTAALAADPTTRGPVMSRGRRMSTPGDT
jgi:HPt (histidine-containing phosphotransfer) domain-containing protein